MMYGCRKSDSCAVPTKSANKLTPLVSAEQVEGRRLVKGNGGACSRFRTQRRIWLARGTNLHTIGVHASRYHLRQEPDALVALVRICGGGVQQCASLLRLPYCMAPAAGRALALGMVTTIVRLVSRRYLLATRCTSSLVTAATLSTRVLIKFGSL
jgi:hypothetical protein